MIGLGRGGFGFCSSGIDGSPVDGVSVIPPSAGVSCWFSFSFVSAACVVSGEAAGGAGLRIIGRGRGGLAGCSAAGSTSETLSLEVVSLACGADAVASSMGFASSGLASEAAGLDSAVERLITGLGRGGLGVSSTCCTGLSALAGVDDSPAAASLSSAVVSCGGFCKAVGRLMTGLGRGDFGASDAASPLAGSIPVAGASAGFSPSCGGFCSAAGRFMTGRGRAGLVASAGDSVPGCCGADVFVSTSFSAGASEAGFEITGRLITGRARGAAGGVLSVVDFSATSSPSTGGFKAAGRRTTGLALGAPVGATGFSSVASCETSGATGIVAGASVSVLGTGAAARRSARRGAAVVAGFGTSSSRKW